MKSFFKKIILQELLQINPKFIYKNREKIKEFNLNKRFFKYRKHGVSAMMRVKNDADWIYYAITSILEYVDEIVIVLQKSTDNTEKIIESIESDKIKVYNYPFETFPTGKYHFKYVKNTVFNLAYYYNYALSKTKYSYVWKWDGDQAVLNSRAKELRAIIDLNKYDIIHAKGYDIFGRELKYLCKDPFCGNEPCIFKVSKKTFYFSGTRSEEFSYPLLQNFRRSRIYNFEKPLFMHFKYTRDTVDMTKGWQKDWNQDLYFLNVLERKSIGELYIDEYPTVIVNEYFNKRLEGPQTPEFSSSNRS
jgi:hypothetical protein